jgi:hypothetical protein
MPAECGAEGARRSLADAFGDFGDPELAAAQQILRNGHAPGETQAIGGSGGNGSQKRRDYERAARLSS